MKIVDKALGLFWLNTKRMDDKRIATLKTPEGVFESNNHEYLPDGHKYHKLDVYYPEGATEKLPVIVDIHGGGWMYGDKELNKNYCLTLAKRGNVVFNISYPLYPEITSIEQLRHVASAMEWIYNNLDNYPCDKNSICLTGDSAGGMLALYTSMLSQSEKMREIFDVPDFSLKFNAVCLTSAMSYMDDGTITSKYTKIMLGKNYKKEKWADYVNVDKILELGEMIPTFMVTSSGDFLAKDQVERTAKLFEEKGIECELMNWDKFEDKDLPHVFAILYPDHEPSRKTIDAMLTFFKKHSKVEV